MPTGRIPWTTLAFAAAVLVLAMPAVLFRYLPMTDLPQHQAVLAILLHFDDPSYGFSDLYRLDLTASPYLLPYGIGALLGQVMPVGDAMHALAALSVAAVPLGVLAVARALRRQAWAALLAFPLAYDRAFFWGFVNLKLGIGFGLFAIAATLAEPQSRRVRAGGALATVAAAFTHPYGLALPIAYLAAHTVAGGGIRHLATRWAVLAPALACAVAWAFASGAAQGYDEPIYPPLIERLYTFPAQVLGGFQDSTEAALLVLLAAGLAAAIAGRMRPPGRAFPPADRAFLLLAAANLVLYLVLPQATSTAKFVHFRHAALAMLLAVPLAMPAAGAPAGRPLGAARALATCSAVFAVANTFVHLWAFDGEARTFDAVRERIPPRARVVSLLADPQGEVMRTAPYLHFVAYAQADKGALPAVTFPRLFWNLPVRFREDSGVPETPVRFEWNPQAFDFHAFGHAYDWVVLRRPGRELVAPGEDFPYEPVLLAPPWQLYRRAEVTR